VKLALIQQHVTLDKAENVTRGLRAIDEAAANGATLACFAELALEPFYPQRPAVGSALHLAEPVPGPTTHAFAKKAREHGMVIVLNLYERDGDRAFDCSPVIDADGRLLGRTRMVHITEYACFHEQGYYASGDEPRVYETAAGRIGVAICYDRHFPEYMRALARQGADVVLVPQAGAVDEWPEGMYEAEMQIAAFHQGCFVALCNRVGAEERLTFSGESFVCGPDGTVRARAPKLQDSILYAAVDVSEVPRSHARRLFFRDLRPDLYARWLALGTPAQVSRRDR
jgi:N-carbamoylputrescine amidase